MFGNPEWYPFVVATITIGIVVVVLGILMRQGLTEAYLHLKREGLQIFLKRPAVQSRKEHNRGLPSESVDVDMDRSKLVWRSIIDVVKGVAVRMKDSRISFGSKIIVRGTEPTNNNNHRGNKSSELHSR